MYTINAAFAGRLLKRRVYFYFAYQAANSRFFHWRLPGCVCR